MNWEDLTNLWNHAFSRELRVDPEEHPVLLSEGPNISRSDREKSFEIMFEKFKIPFCSLIPQPLLSLIERGSSTGLVVDIGDQQTNMVPVYEGTILDTNSQKVIFGGKDLTNYLVELFSNDGFMFNSISEKEIVRDMKEKLCLVAKNGSAKPEADTGPVYELPDGQIVPMSLQRYSE